MRNKSQDICLFFCFVSLLLTGCKTQYRTYTNLGYPTQYVFNSDQSKVEAVIDKLDGEFLIPHVMKLYKTPKGQIRLGVFPCYSSNYWSGPQETHVDLPEAGKIGEIEADFIVNVVPKGQQALVTVEVENFDQQTGRTYTIIYDFHKTRVLVDVKSDTYFEYVFLKKLGEQLGETNMPELKKDLKIAD